MSKYENHNEQLSAIDLLIETHVSRDHLSEYAAHLEGSVAASRAAVEAADKAQAELDAIEAPQRHER